jgi:hypothetical protein
MKMVSNEIFGVFERYKRGECTYDRALEDVSNIINKYANEKPIVGYVQSGAVKKIFAEILNNKKPNPDKVFLFDCKIHHVDIDTIQRMYNSM